MIKKIYVSKGDSIIKDNIVEGAEIHIIKSIPPFKTIEEAQEYYKNDALDIFNILKNHLPHGTIYQLLIKMLEYSPILYRGNK